MGEGREVKKKGEKKTTTMAKDSETAVSLATEEGELCSHANQYKSVPRRSLRKVPFAGKRAKGNSGYLTWKQHKLNGSLAKGRSKRNSIASPRKERKKTYIFDCATRSRKFHFSVPDVLQLWREWPLCIRCSSWVRFCSFSRAIVSVLGVGICSSVAGRAKQKWSKGLGFESPHKRRENFLLQGQMLQCWCMHLQYLCFCIVMLILMYAFLSVCEML